jgi:putative NADPH-quinone reductase
MKRTGRAAILLAMGKRILIIDGHPDPRAGRYLHALAKAYAIGADVGGHEVRTLMIGEMEFPLLASNEAFRDKRPPRPIGTAQEEIAWADHLVILYPLWLGSMPAKLKAFFEQVLRPGFAFAESRGKGLPRKLLKGKSARIVVTMGMPALFYRFVYRAHSLKSLERNILSFCGIRPVRASLVGVVEGMSLARRQAWLGKMERLGVRAL